MGRWAAGGGATGLGAPRGTCAIPAHALCAGPHYMHRAGATRCAPGQPGSRAVGGGRAPTWKNLASVRTERQAAPPRSYACAICRRFGVRTRGGRREGGRARGCRWRRCRAGRPGTWSPPVCCALCMAQTAPCGVWPTRGLAATVGCLRSVQSAAPHARVHLVLATCLDRVKVGLDDALARGGLLDLRLSSS